MNNTKTSPTKYRATVCILGARDSHHYGKNLAKLEVTAIKRLTRFEPGMGSLFPIRVRIERHVKTLSGNRAIWEKVKFIEYDDVPEDQFDWKIRREARMSAPKIVEKIF